MKKDNKNLTGFPHIDKPWMQYYNEEEVDEINEDLDMNIAEYIEMKNKNNGSGIAIEYYGNEITHDELQEKRRLAAKAFSQIGVKQGDILYCLMPNTPESEYILFGASDLGAVADFTDPRPDSMDVEANAKKVLEMIKYEQADYIITLDKCYLYMLKPIENELKNIGIKKIITTSAMDSMTPEGLQNYMKDVVIYDELNKGKIPNLDIQNLQEYKIVLEKMKQAKQDDEMYKEFIKSSPIEVLSLNQLMKECEKSNYDIVSDNSLPVYMGHTSGTSGSRPKPILLTNKNSISNIEQCLTAKIAAPKGSRALHVLPYFAPFGLYDNNLLNLAAGVTNIDIPEFQISDYGYLIKKYKPNALMTTPAWLTALPNYELLKDEDLSYIQKIIYGGDSMPAKDEEMLNEWLKTKGSSAEIEKGHGMSEFCGCGTYARGDYNAKESIGIPLPKVIYTVVDPNVTDKLVPVTFRDNEEYLKGELVVSSNCVTPGIIKNGDVIIPHYEMDGKEYMRTGDSIKMDRNGVFYHEGRIDRSFPRYDGYKVKPVEIEREIQKHENVKEAKIVPYYDEKFNGNMPICHITVEQMPTSNEEIEKLVHEIVFDNIIGNPEMSSRQIPTRFKIREVMPLSKNGKTDFKYLASEKFDGSEIIVDIKETNLNVESINIHLNNVKKLEFK